MDKQMLIQNLVSHMATPQAAERWAMYCLICPVVDFANGKSGLVSEFEHLQRSAHGTFQKVDIALLDSETRSARVMVEAKGFDKPVSAELIEKYLEPSMRGAVTNGCHWVLCMGGSSKIVALSRSDGMFIEQALDEVVSFLRGEQVDASSWDAQDAYTAKRSRSSAPKKIVRANPASTSAGTLSSDAREQSNAAKPEKSTLWVDSAGLGDVVQALKSAKPLEAVFLSALATRLASAHPLAHYLKFEVRETRVSFWDQRVSSLKEGRIARIKLGANQPDVIVRTNLVESDERLSNVLPHVVHERGRHMRRFRLSDAVQTERFAAELARVLTTWTPAPQGIT
ncbi:hypothetical protein [Ralstonia pseudosolanacearum]|uniref:hypothetical protein n=1 Tax=Ralstonia pseudosolanacearum TaxID=1310165 RepID=UPI001FFA62E7|nr:hypothetical protein [Ralstonia pseudosolanacearum]